MCGHMPASIEERYGDFGHMFEQLLRTKDSGEVWETFYPTDDQWPADGELESYKVNHFFFCPRHPSKCSGTCMLR